MAIDIPFINPADILKNQKTVRENKLIMSGDLKRGKDQRRYFQRLTLTLHED